MTVLSAIVTRKRGALNLRDPDMLPCTHPAPRGFARAIKTVTPQGPMAVIAEVKRQSPSGGQFPHKDVVAVARRYEQCGARAISVLTDAEDFGGSLEDLIAVRAAVGLPVLRKDFLVDPGEVYQSARAGADAVLLIAEALDDATLAAMLAAAKRAGIDALVEAHTLAQAERALSAGATVMGINNRDLATLRTDLSTCRSVLPALRPRTEVLVAESGLRTTKDLEQVRTAGADAALVGESLLRAQDPGQALRELLGTEAR